MAGLAFRPFGQQRSDLDIDFEQPSPPHLVTDLIASCSVDRADRGSLWQLTVGRRTACLLQIACRTGLSKVHIALPCRRDDCQELIEARFDLADCIALQQAAEKERHLSVVLADRTVTLRRPTGLDQRTWQAQLEGAPSVVIRAMLQTLAVEPSQVEDIDDQELGSIERALQDCDPLVSLPAEVICPCCEQPNSVTADLQKEALNRLHRRQQQLVEEVHRLASVYHWPESEIAALPPWRRRRYLDLINRQRRR